jgi:hypothetical protein
MNLEEIKSRSDKLNRYYEFLASLRGSVSALDRDVLLMQLREFYEAVLFAELETSSIVKKNSDTVILKEKHPVVEIKEEIVEKKPEIVEQKTTIVIETPEIKEEVKEQFIENKVQKEEPITVNIEPVIETPLVKEMLTETIKETPKIEHTPKVVEIQKVEEPIKIEETTKQEKQEELIQKVKTPETIHNDRDFEFNPEFEELFIFKQATDLAAKLSESPIADLSKVLGVNEKLLYTKELFGGDTAKINEAVSFFNRAGFFDKARSFIEFNLIEQYNWMSKEKKASAREFIKLIRRRYL